LLIFLFLGGWANFAMYAPLLNCLIYVRCEGTASYSYVDAVKQRYYYALAESEADCLTRMPEEAPVPGPEVGKDRLGGGGYQEACKN
jgi:hypothetical protein